MPGTNSQKPPAVKPAASKAAAPMPFGLLSPYPKPAGMSPAQFELLQAHVGPRWADLLLHIPYKLLDRTQTPTAAAAPVGERATLLLKVIRRPPLPRFGTKRPLAIELADETGALRALYFNPGGWLERAYPVGAHVIVSGKIEADKTGKKIIHPDVFNAGRGLENIATLAPLYPGTAGLPHGWLVRAIHAAVEAAQMAPAAEWLPPNLREAIRLSSKLEGPLPSFTEALTALHKPATEADLAPTTPARTRLGFDELFASQLALAHARATTRQQPGLAHGSHTGLQRKLVASLPYALTPDQARVLEEIHADLVAPRPMLRLVQGDVGAGKTLVALLALLHVIENGHQGALMAPTAILAQQHYATAKKLLEPLGITVGLLIGSHTAAQKKKLKQHVREGFVNLLIGTHALVEDDVVFDKLGLVCIDEQHRFGVKQRAAFSANTNLPPDVLVLTATPIPRTLALTAYGDMDVSIIRTKPPGRTPITTSLKPLDALPELATALGRKTQKNEQVYWVCPLVEESEDTDLTAATARYETLQALYPGQVGLLHGKLKSPEKDAVMAAFARGDVKILVATTVIEVGVDVPQATLMVIEHAERFGLSQLHQLRGRVGRGKLASQCVLLYGAPLTDFGRARLQALKDSDDGFYLAEKDLELRGPGEVLGTRQSGHNTTQLADLFHHQHLIPIAKEAAQAIWQAPLNAAQKNALALLLGIFNKTAAAHYLRGG